jgi:hypothetical protein
MMPMISQNKAKKLNCSISDHRDINAIIIPMYIKMVPPSMLVMPVRMDQL